MFCCLWSKNVHINYNWVLDSGTLLNMVSATAGAASTAVTFIKYTATFVIICYNDNIMFRTLANILLDNLIVSHKCAEKKHVWLCIAHKIYA